MSPLAPFAPIFSGIPGGALFASAFLALVLLACISDVRSRRIPNVIVLLMALGGGVFAFVRDGSLAGVGSAALGLLVGFAIWIVFYAIGALGAGDVKFFAAASAWLGPSGAWRAALVAAAIGGALAVAFLLRDAKLTSTLHRVLLASMARSLEVTKVHAMSREEARRQLPYGVALGLGVVVVALFPAILS